MISFDELREANESRVRLWHPDFNAPPTAGAWSGADWSNAMCGEAGEAANIVKKIRRYECGLKGMGDPSFLELIEMLGEELADTVTYADLLAAYYGLDLGIHVAAKFNKVSEKQGFPQRLGNG